VVLPILRRAYPIAASVWLLALPLATYAATRVHASTVTDSFALAVYGIGALVCHQRPERSFHLWHAQLPVCARCAGIYVGAAVVAMAVAGRAIRGAAIQRASTPGLRERERVRAVVAACALPTVATLLFEWTTGITPSNALRFAAGLPLGAVVSWLVLK